MRGAAIAEVARERRRRRSRAFRATRLARDRRGHGGERQVRGHERDAQRRRPPTSSITTRGVCVRCGEELGVAGERDARVLSTLFCTGAVTSAANAPVAHASAARVEHREHRLPRSPGSGAPGVDGHRDGLVPDLDAHGVGSARPPRIERGVTAAQRPMRCARAAQHVAIADDDEPRGPRPLAMAHREHRDELGADARGLAGGDRDRRARSRASQAAHATSMSGGVAEALDARRPALACDREARRPAATSIFACAKPSSGCVGLAEHPELLERPLAVDLAGVLDGAAERQRVAFAAEHRKLVERRPVADHAAARRCAAAC